MIYTEEELEKFANMHGTQLTKEEVEAVWDWLDLKDKENLEKYSYLKIEYPELTDEDIIEIAEGETTLEEALAKHSPN